VAIQASTFDNMSPRLKQVWDAIVKLDSTKPDLKDTDTVKHKRDAVAAMLKPPAKDPTTLYAHYKTLISFGIDLAEHGILYSPQARSNGASANATTAAKATAKTSDSIVATITALRAERSTRMAEKDVAETRIGVIDEQLAEFERLAELLAKYRS